MLLLLHGTSALAKAEADDPAPLLEDWTFMVAPYGWLAAVDVDIVSGGETTS